MTFAGSSPEILITRIAAATDTIRVSSGTAMQPHYSLYKVAENFRLFETMFPGRIDLGIGTEPGSDMLTAQAVAYRSEIVIEYLGNKLADLSALIRHSPVTAGLEPVVATPRSDTVPELWLLGSSAQSAANGVHFGSPCSFAHFIAPDQNQQSIEQYDRHSQPSIDFQKRTLAFGVCAETEAKTQALAACRDFWRLRFAQCDQAQCDQAQCDQGSCPSIKEALA